MKSPREQAELELTIGKVDASGPAGQPLAAIVRVRNADGRLVERSVRFGKPEKLPVGAGIVDVDVVLSTGQLLSRAVPVDAGQPTKLSIDVPESPNEAMRWLSLSHSSERRRGRKRAPAPSAGKRTWSVATSRGFAPALGVQMGLQIGLHQLEVPWLGVSTSDAVEPAGNAMPAYGFLQLGATTIEVLSARAYPEGHVLHVRDSRPAQDLRSSRVPGQSAVAFLLLGAENGARRRICALPGPFAQSTEVHVALREQEGETLPLVDVVPAHAELGPIIGFLRRGDQRALSLLSSEIETSIELLADKVVDPVPAAIGLSLLLRVGELSKVQGWSRHFWKMCPGLSDAAALHAAILLRHPADSKDWIEEFRAAVVDAVGIGVPLLSDSLRRLHDAASVLCDIDESDARSRQALQWCRRMLRAADPEDVFTTLTLPSDELEQVFGLKELDMPDDSALDPNDGLHTLRKTFAPILQVLTDKRAELRQIPGLAVARPGYTLRAAGAEPALVLALHPLSPKPDVAALSQVLGVLVRTSNASPAEQLLGAKRAAFTSSLLRLLEPDLLDFAAPRRGTYEPPTGPDAPRLETVDEDMVVTACASPDAGWPVLRDFLAEEIEEELVVAMYDFTAKHVEQAVLDAFADNEAVLKLVLDAKPASGGVGGTGINGKDREEAKLIAKLRTALGDRFELTAASVGAGGAVPKAYHIKVAVADGRRFWLSSGNWQSSNQAPFDFAEPNKEPPFPLTRYNRDYHVVVENETLATCYAKFIEYDATLGGDFAGPSLDTAPALLIPEEEEAADFAPIKRFKPKTFDERIKVTPLLTPDNFPKVVNKLLAGAKKRVWLQNQYIQPNEEGDNFPEFDKLLATLGKLSAKDDFDLRLCLRSPEEPYRDRLLAAGVSPKSIRRQKNCHAKLIVIDDDIVVVGSQNLSNVGFVANRDASLAFEHAGIAEYFADVFEADWERASPIADDDSFAVRIVDADTAPPEGWVKVPWSAVYDSPPPFSVSGLPEPAPAAAEPPAFAAGGSVASSAALDLPLFGVDPDTGRKRTESSSAVANALRQGAGTDPARSQLGRMLAGKSFAGPPGTDDQSLSDMGWGVVWGQSVTPAIKAALAPLLKHRRDEVGDAALFHELSYQPETVRQFLQRNGSDFGSTKPQSVPAYLLLVGGPDDIPYSFQTLLDVEYRVGRLDLPSPEAYAKYAESVIAVETGAAAARDRVLHTFGPAHPGDVPTKLSVEVLVRSADAWLNEFEKLKKKHGLSARTDPGDAATKARLLEVLRGQQGRPELLFTASHGLACSPGSPRQPGEQGAVVTADWDGFSAIDASSRFAAGDLPADADVFGMVAFLFACYGAGTPATDIFPTRNGQALAPKPLSSALPRALLSHQKGSCLGVFGHIDRTLTWSLQPPQAPVATNPFANGSMHILHGSRLGTALDDLNQRGATLASSVALVLQPGVPPTDDTSVVSLWTQQRDASTFVLLGDPAAKLRR